MPKGVCFRADCKNKPYRVWIGRRIRYFATEEEAVAVREAYRAAKVEAKAAARAKLKHKRDRDVAIFGNNLSQERDVALALVVAWREATGLPALVLNDNTRADVLLGKAQHDAWLPMQLKTTAGAEKGKANMWRFAKVTGYRGMAVVCWRCDVGDAWVYDGDALDAREQKNLGVTPGGKNCALALARHLDLSALVEWLRARVDQWPAVSEDAARHDFASVTHALEMAGIDAYRARFPEHQYAYPEAQNGHVDLLRDGARLQFKTACAAPGGSAGFLCHLKTSAGHNEAGKRLVAPYPSDAFDELVAVAWVEGVAHFWAIPASELEARGYLRSATQPGKLGLYLHAPTIGVQPDPGARTPADTWTSVFFKLKS